MVTPASGCSVLAGSGTREGSSESGARRKRQFLYASAWSQTFGPRSPQSPDAWFFMNASSVIVLPSPGGSTTNASGPAAAAVPADARAHARAAPTRRFRLLLSIHSPPAASARERYVTDRPWRRGSAERQDQLRALGACGRVGGGEPLELDRTRVLARVLDDQAVVAKAVQVTHLGGDVDREPA